MPEPINLPAHNFPPKIGDLVITPAGRGTLCHIYEDGKVQVEMEGGSVTYFLRADVLPR